MARSHNQGRAVEEATRQPPRPARPAPRTAASRVLRPASCCVPFGTVGCSSWMPGIALAVICGATRTAPPARRHRRRTQHQRRAASSRAVRRPRWIATLAALAVRRRRVCVCRNARLSAASLRVAKHLHGETAEAPQFVVGRGAVSMTSSRASSMELESAFDI